MRITEKKLSKLVDDYKRAGASGGLREFKPYASRESLLTVAALLEHVTHRTINGCLNRGSFDRLTIKCRQCKRVHIHRDKPFCSLKCASKFVRITSKEVGWASSKVSETEKTFKIRLSCWSCGKEKGFGIDWIRSQFGCNCQRGAKVSDLLRLSHQDFVDLLRRNGVKVTLLETYRGMNTYIRYRCDIHPTFAGEAIANNLQRGHGCSICGREKFEATSLRKYGTESPSRADAVKKRRYKTMFHRYGTKHALQSPELFAKMVNTSFRRTKVLLCGVPRFVQGYEPYAIRWLITNGVPETDIAVGDDPRLPKITWVDSDRKVRVYHPDIYVVSKNLIVEVKSTYTYTSNLSLIRKKRDATIEAGYRFAFFIADPKSGAPISPRSLCTKQSR